MSEVTANKLKSDVDAILQRVQDEGEQFEVIRDGQVVARIVPAGLRLANQALPGHDDVVPGRRALSPSEREQLEAMWAKRAELIQQIKRSSERNREVPSPVPRTTSERAAWLAEFDALAERIDSHMSEDISIVDATNDLRRDL